MTNEEMITQALAAHEGAKKDRQYRREINQLEQLVKCKKLLSHWKSVFPAIEVDESTGCYNLLGYQCIPHDTVYLITNNKKGNIVYITTLAQLGSLIDLDSQEKTSFTITLEIPPGYTEHEIKYLVGQYTRQR